MDNSRTLGNLHRVATVFLLPISGRFRTWRPRFSPHFRGGFLVPEFAEGRSSCSFAGRANEKRPEAAISREPTSLRSDLNILGKERGGGRGCRNDPEKFKRLITVPILSDPCPFVSVDIPFSISFFLPIYYLAARDFRKCRCLFFHSSVCDPPTNWQ